MNTAKFAEVDGAMQKTESNTCKNCLDHIFS